MFENYKAVSLALTKENSINFPLNFEVLKKRSSTDMNDDEEKKQGYDPNAINLKLKELVLMVHGNLESKPKLIDDFNDQNPECSKNSIEKKLKEGFVKDKRGHDPR